MDDQIITRKNNSRPESITGIVDKIINSLGLNKGCQGWLAVSRWPEIVGEHYARKSRAIRYHDGVLYVAVEDSSWRQTMTLDKDRILQAIHAETNSRVVKDIRLVYSGKGT